MISGKKCNKLLLQILIITLALLVVPAAANAPPTVLGGTLMIDGEPAPVGTEVSLVVDGDVVGQTTVTNEGLIGDERSNRLGVSSDHNVVMVHVNGEPKQSLDISANNDGMIKLDLSVTSVTASDGETAESSSSSGTKKVSTGGGGFSTGVAADVEEESEQEPVSQVSDEKNLLSTSDKVVEEVPDEGTEPESIFGGSMVLVFGLMLVGATIVVYKYRSK